MSDLADQAAAMQAALASALADVGLAIDAVLQADGAGPVDCCDGHAEVHFERLDPHPRSSMHCPTFWANWQFNVYRCVNLTDTGEITPTNSHTAAMTAVADIEAVVCRAAEAGASITSAMVLTEGGCVAARVLARTMFETC